MNLIGPISICSIMEVPRYTVFERRYCCACLPLETYFLSMLRRIFSLELSSALSETYASGLDIVGTSVAGPVDVAAEGAGAALALLVDESGEGVVVMIAYM